MVAAIIFKGATDVSFTGQTGKAPPSCIQVSKQPFVHCCEYVLLATATLQAAVACQQLSGLALGDRAAKSMLKGMGVGSKINITFLQVRCRPAFTTAVCSLLAASQESIHVTSGTTYHNLRCADCK